MSIRRFFEILIIAAFLASGASGQEPEGAVPSVGYRVGIEADSLFFDRISGVAALPDGRLVVAEMRAARVRLIKPGALGSELVGGPGGGPGEFRSPAEVGRVAEGFWVYDLGAMRMSLFSDDGRIRQTFRTPPLTGATALLSEGVVAGTRRRLNDGEDAEGRWVVLFDPDERSARDSIRLEQPWRTFTLQSGDLDISSLQLWSDHTLWKPGPEGAGVVLVDRPTTGAPEVVVRWYHSTGALRRMVRVAYEPVPISDETVRRVAKAYSTAILDPRNRLGPSVDRSDLSPSAITERIYVPDRLPPVSAMVVGTNGEAYLRRGMPDEDAPEVEYWIVDETGLIASLALPAGFRPMSADEQGLWGVEKDPLDREYLVHYRIQVDPTRDRSPADGGAGEAAGGDDGENDGTG